MLAPSHYFQRAVHEIERNYKSMEKSQRIRVERWVEKLVNSGGNAAWNRHRNAYVKLLLMMVLKKKLEEPYHALPADGQLPPFPSHLKVLLKQTSDLHANEFWRDVYDRMDVLDTTSHSNMTYRQHLEDEVEEIITASHGNQHSFLNHDMSAISAAHSHQGGYPEGKEGSVVKNRTIRSPNQSIRSPALSAMHTSRATTQSNLNSTTILDSPTRAHSPYRQTKHVSINESHMGSPAKSPIRHKHLNNKSRVQPAGYAPRPVHNEQVLDAEYGRLWGNVSHARIPHETEALRAMVREQMVRIEILEQQLQDTTVKYEEEIQSLRHQHIRELTELKDSVGNKSKSYLRNNASSNNNNGYNYSTIGNTSTFSNSIRNPEYLETSKGQLKALDSSIYDVPSPRVTATMEPNHSDHSPNASMRSSYDHAREYNSLEFEKGIGAGIASGTIGGGTDMDASVYDLVSSSVNPVGVKAKNDMYGSPDRESTASEIPKVHHIHMASPPPKNWKVDIEPIPTIDRKLEKQLALEYKVSNDSGKIKHPDELASSLDASLGGPLVPMSNLAIMPGPMIGLPSSSTDSLSATVLTQRWVNESSNGLSLTLANSDDFPSSNTLIPADPTGLDDSTSMKSLDEDKHFLEYLEDFQSDLKKDSQIVMFEEH